MLYVRELSSRALGVLWDLPPYFTRLNDTRDLSAKFAGTSLKQSLKLYLPQPGHRKWLSLKRDSDSVILGDISRVTGFNSLIFLVHSMVQRDVDKLE